MLGLHITDLRPGEGRVFVREGKGGRQLLVPICQRVFRPTAAYLSTERPPDASTDR